MLPIAKIIDSVPRRHLAPRRKGAATTESIPFRPVFDTVRIATGARFAEFLKPFRQLAIRMSLSFYSVIRKSFLFAVSCQLSVTPLIRAELEITVIFERKLARMPLERFSGACPVWEPSRNRRFIVHLKPCVESCR